ncbi:Asp23/Gls24 family envelope stress response protein [Brevibacterium aurantiacum]|uniref:Asp23/Gls24 family envelope stress response protein n=1 Tax=Brevibacterium aurantiacum TaxID=273384 RepID=A0A556C5D9_BREAU|nr:Asp23/Gls24 family envelope stress response protein [Brevibacterium aurantiacum]TSI12674.1 Asp23/Gls24 family envelope stress response protein [Brevibacterium aurantiacum]
MPEAQQSTATEQKTNDSVRSPLVTDMGNTTIAENVVAKLTGITAREVPGVYGMGNAARRAFDTLTDRIPGSQTNVSGGVSVEKGEKQTAIDLTIVVEYGTSIVDVAEAIRRNVVRAVEQGTGLQVVEVNIDVTDVHLPEEDDEEAPAKDSPELN